MKNMMLIIILVLSSIIAAGQYPRIQLGVEGGPGLALMFSPKNWDQFAHTRLGFATGLTLQWDATSLFSFRTGLSFERKGSAFSYEDEQDKKVITHLNKDYLILPLLARLSFGKKVRFFINAGPYFGYLLHTSSENELWGPFSSNRDIVIPNSTSYWFDFGISAGLGIFIPVCKNIGLSLEARDNLGFIDTAEGTRNNSTNFLFGASYLF
jgi:hypothetical protein